jgi:hypothetical protein
MFIVLNKLMVRCVDQNSIYGTQNNNNNNDATKKIEPIIQNLPFIQNPPYVKVLQQYPYNEQNPLLRNVQVCRDHNPSDYKIAFDISAYWRQQTQANRKYKK